MQGLAEDVIMDKSPLDKDTLLKSILSKGREIIKVKNAHKREKEMSKTNSLQKNLNLPLNLKPTSLRRQSLIK